MASSRLSLHERYRIQALLEAGNSLRTIALIVQRSASTISRELRRNCSGRGYEPEAADASARNASHRSTRCCSRISVPNRLPAVPGWPAMSGSTSTSTLIRGGVATCSNSFAAGSGNVENAACAMAVGSFSTGDIGLNAPQWWRHEAASATGSWIPYAPPPARLWLSL